MEQKLAKINKIMHKFIAQANDKYVASLYEKVSSGKMLRSKLLLNVVENQLANNTKISNFSESKDKKMALDSENLSAKTLKKHKKIIKKALKLCSVIELIQSASLLHDDVIDNAHTRRNRPSINAEFGDKNAIMLGDVLYSKAFFELTKFDKKIAQSVADSVFYLSIGEIDDVFMARKFNENLSDYLRMIELKTAALIAASAHAGAILSGADSQVCENYRIYGVNLGIAFQIIDDILDITQDSQTLGKPAFSDFTEGKTTLPYIYLYERLDSGNRAKLLALFGKNLEISESSWIKEQMIAHNCILDSVKLAKKYAKTALECVDGVNEKCAEIAKEMVDRNF